MTATSDKTHKIETTDVESTPVSFTVKPHKTTIVVWDVPPTIVLGDKFRIKAGLKCSSECRLTGRDFGIYDGEGRQAATATLGGDPWPGTDALYFAEVDLQAPDTEGQYTWEAKVGAFDTEFPHAGASSTFGVRIVRRPECLVTVETIDRDQQTPIKGLQVVMHPYRTVTDERGVAELRVPKGEYKIFISGRRYMPIRTDVEVTADITTKAELTLEPPNPRL